MKNLLRRIKKYYSHNYTKDYKMPETISREGFDILGRVIREWLEEEGFETNVSQDLELQNRILNSLGIKKKW